MKKTLLLSSLLLTIVVTSRSQQVTSEGLNAYARTTPEARAQGIDHDGGRVYGGAIYATQGTRLRKVFTVNVSQGGSYFFSAHAMGVNAVPASARPGAGSKAYPLQEISVYIDDQYQGKLAMTTNDWQSAAIRGADRVTIGAGKHTIAFESEGPSYPEVDALKLSANAEKAGFDMTVYRKYVASLKATMEKNKAGVAKIEPQAPPLKSSMTQPVQTSGDVSTNSASNSSYSWEVTPYTLANPAANFHHVMTVPVVYTYYRRFSFSAGQNITFHTVPTGTDSYNTVDPVMYVYCATNNTGWSNDDYTGFHPRVQFTAPVTGDYYLVLRAYSNYHASSAQGSQGLVNVYQNGNLLQADAPVSGYIASMPSANDGLINFFTGYSTGIPMLWLTTAGNLSPIRFHGGVYWYLPPMDHNWFDDARFRIQKTGSGTVDYSLLVASEGAWYVYWGNADIYGAARSTNLSSWFPNLKSSDAIQSAPSTNTYNCGAWAGGITNGWFWGCLYPNASGVTCSSLNYGYAYSWSTWDNYFGNNPPRYAGAKTYTRDQANSSNAEIALWSTNGDMSGLTHLSVRREANSNPHGYDWESKPGGLERIFHPTNALAGNDYGNIFSHYRDAARDPYMPWGRSAAPVAAANDDEPLFSIDESVALGLTVLPRVELAAEEKSKLSELKALNTAPIARIDLLYSNWMTACGAEALQIYSNPVVFLDLPECKKIIAFSEQNMEATTTFLMDKIMTGDENSFEVQMTSFLLSGITHPRYGRLMDQVHDEWRQHNYTDDGAYIAPVPLAHTKNYIKKILDVNYLQKGPHQAETSADNHENFQVYPNPVVDQSRVLIRLQEPATVAVSLFDQKGSLARVLEEGKNLKAGNYQYTVQAADYKAGLYLCKITVNGRIYTRKVLIR